MKLNLGSSDALLAGFVNVDIWQPPNIPAGIEFLKRDLSKLWPWPDNSVDEIRAFDIIEHLADKIHTLNECWRVLRSGGRLHVCVPTTDGRGAWQDPQHISYWNRNSFFYFTAGVPERERFGAAYGIVARFKVISERTERLVNEVVKLTILLEAVKP